MKQIFQVEEEMDEDTVKEAAGLIRNIFRYMDKDAKGYYDPPQEHRCGGWQ